MLLISFASGPSAGKSTLAASLFVDLKAAGYKVELVGEAAREDAIYPGCMHLLDNQLLLAGLQYERIRRLERVGMDIAISDSPLIQGLMYGRHLPYINELEAVLRIIEKQWPTYNVFVNRTAKYDGHCRLQTEADVIRMDAEARGLLGEIWLEIDGNEYGRYILKDKVIEMLKERNVGVSNV